MQTLGNWDQGLDRTIFFNANHELFCVMDESVRMCKVGYFEKTKVE